MDPQTRECGVVTWPRLSSIRSRMPPTGISADTSLPAPPTGISADTPLPVSATSRTISPSEMVGGGCDSRQAEG
jgi:hypothetical protein